VVDCDIDDQIAEILKELRSEAEPSERRRAPRRTYAVNQLVAPYIGWKVPPEPAFCEVPCIDISTGGISFIWPTEPDFEHVVVALGKPPKQVCLSARVVSSRPYDGESEGVRLGCQVLGRLADPS